MLSLFTSTLAVFIITIIFSKLFNRSKRTFGRSKKKLNKLMNIEPDTDIVAESTSLKNTTLKYTAAAAAAVITGRRPTLEDDHFVCVDFKEDHLHDRPADVLADDPMVNSFLDMPTDFTLKSVCPKEGESPHIFMSVFDGHAGRRAATYASENVWRAYVNSRHVDSDPALALCDAVETTEAKLKQTWAGQEVCDGAAAVIVSVKDDVIYSANLGDSRAVLARGRHAIALTVDHKPSRSAEEVRVMHAGGYVAPTTISFAAAGPFGDIPMGPPRVWPGGLALSRAIGDFRMKLGKDDNENPYLNGPIVCSIPELRQVKLDPEHDTFIINACDGLWDVMTSREAVLMATEFIREALTEEMQNGVKGLAPHIESIAGKGVSTTNIEPIPADVLERVAKKTAYSMIEKAFDMESADNISVSIVLFQFPGRTLFPGVDLQENQLGSDVYLAGDEEAELAGASHIAPVVHRDLDPAYTADVQELLPRAEAMRAERQSPKDGMNPPHILVAGINLMG